MEAIITITGFVEWAILLLMVGLSVWSVSIMVAKKRLLREEISEADFNEICNKLRSGQVTTSLAATQLPKGIFVEAFKALSDSAVNGTKNVSADTIVLQMDRSMSQFIKEKRSFLQKDLYILASLGSNAPFIGLFGTVLGIIRAFAYLGSQSGSAAVMSGVSQALYATAVGLLVAIPAVTAYNFYSNRIKKAISQIEIMRDLFISQNLRKLQG